MSDLVFYALATGISLVAGAIIGEYFNFKQKIVAMIMAFGAGMLVCTLSFGLMEESFKLGGHLSVITGFLLGGISFVVGDYLLHVYGGRKHKRIQIFKPIKETNGRLIVLGTILDGMPESIALGVALAKNQLIGLLVLVAICASNFAESIASIDGLRKEKFSKKNIVLLWTIVAVATYLVVYFSFFIFRDISGPIVGFIEAFAAGAILAMLSNSMMPEAFEEGGMGIALLTIFGFLLAFILTRI